MALVAPASPAKDPTVTMRSSQGSRPSLVLSARGSFPSMMKDSSFCLKRKFSSVAVAVGWDFSASASFLLVSPGGGRCWTRNMVWCGACFQSILRLPELSSGDQGSARKALP